jgi:hypothetical protein
MEGPKQWLGGGGTPQRSCTTVGWGLKSILTFTGKKMWNPYYEICSYTTKSIVYPYYGNIQLLWITKIHSISNKGPYNFHSMTFYGFSKFFPVVRVTFCDMGISLVQQIMLYKWEIIFHVFIVFSAKSCPDPGRPRNGDAKGLFVFGEKVYYTCDQCYKLKGPGYRQCQADQEWTDTQPTCERKYFECILRYDDFCIYWYRRN